jgi:hypothetical protein
MEEGNALATYTFSVSQSAAVSLGIVCRLLLRLSISHAIAGIEWRNRSLITGWARRQSQYTVQPIQENATWQNGLHLVIS